MDQFLTETQIIDYWNKIKAFETSLNLTSDKPKFIFYDGPPFATGLPHYGHIVASTLKDIIPRYKSQTGYHVERRFGWDTHGLPIEYEIEKMLGIKTKEQILELGIDKYNQHCRDIVLKYRSEWRQTIERLGRWVDFDNDYKTMDTSFMESVWWVFNQLYNKNLVYRGVKVMPYSTGCTTPLSNFEANSNYKTVSDPSVTVKFKITSELLPEYYLLVWTTTPWTLPSNLAVCLNPNLTYLAILSNRDNQYYIIASECLNNYFKEGYTIINTYMGKELQGISYQPLFPYFEAQFKDTAFKIITDTYVASDSGTGLVHVAPAFGKDDYRVCQEQNIISKTTPPPCPLDANGRFTQSVTDYQGQYIKDADTNIMDDLQLRNLIFRIRKEKHEYPYCWRSETPLIYRTIPSWFINVESIKDKVVKNNQDTYWIPKVIRDNKFGNWLENAIDWCVSRNRYWGTPIPIWVSSDFEEIICVGSITELEELAGLPKNSITDLHRHHIDHITIPSKKGKGDLKRIEEVFDCWFESGSMPYAQHGYPRHCNQIDNIFPADFIAEGTDQTRGWFYTLMVLSTALFDKPAFKNVIVNGLVLAEDGEKMSKRKKNYPPVDKIFSKYGADAVRLYLIDGPVVKAGELKFKESDVKVIVKNINILMYNMAKYLLQMIDLYQSNKDAKFKPLNIIDNPEIVSNPLDYWILEYANQFIQNVHSDMEAYTLYNIVDRITQFIDKMSRWYLKLNKNRFVDGNFVSLSVLYYCLHHAIITMAPFTPFLSESIYQAIKIYVPNSVKSVHFIQMRKKIWNSSNRWLEPVEYLCKVINATRIIRTKKAQISLKMPINKIVIIHQDRKILASIESLQEYLMYELNLMNLEVSDSEDEYVDYFLKLNMKLLGKRLGRRMREFNKFLDNMPLLRKREIVNNQEDIEVLGETLQFGELVVSRKVKDCFQNYIYHVEEDITILMDTHVSQEMQYKYQCKVFTREIQDFRKEVGLVPADKIKIYYKFLDDSDITIAKIIIDKIALYVTPQIKNELLEYYDGIDFFAKKTISTMDLEMEVYFVRD